MNNVLIGQALTRLMQHLDGSIIQTESVLARDVEFLTQRAGMATGARPVVTIGRILETLALVVARKRSVTS